MKKEAAKRAPSSFRAGGAVLCGAGCCNEIERCGKARSLPGEGARFLRVFAFMFKNSRSAWVRKPCLEMRKFNRDHGIQISFPKVRERGRKEPGVRRRAELGRRKNSILWVVYMRFRARVPQTRASQFFEIRSTNDIMLVSEEFSFTRQVKKFYYTRTTCWARSFWHARVLRVKRFINLNVLHRVVMATS